MLTLGLILELAVTTYAFTSSSDVDALYPEFTAYKEQKKSLYVWSHSTTNRIDGTPAWILLIKTDREK